MKISSILAYAALTIFSAASVAAYAPVFEEALDDLSQALALSTDIQTAAASLDAADFITQAPLIVVGLHGIADLGTKFIKQARYGNTFSDEDAKDVLESAALFIDAQQQLMQALIRKRSLVRVFSYTSQFIQALQALQRAVEGAERALEALIPTRIKEANALFRVINDAIEDALEAFA